MAKRRVAKSPEEAKARYEKRQFKMEDARENAAIAKAEAMFEKMIQQGKVTPGNIRKIKERIANKTGAYPMGGTN